MVPSILSQTKAKVVEALTANPLGNVKFANVRFDVYNGSVIYYHDDIESFSASIDSHPPEKALMFPDNSNNTDIFQVLETFLNTTNIPLCGSTALILTKRLTKINGRFPMLQKLLDERITVHFIQSNYMPFGGVIGSTNDVSGYSGGLYVLTGTKRGLNDSMFPEVAEKIMQAPYLNNLFYSYYVNLPTRNVTDQPLNSLKVPSYMEEYVNVTLAITTDIFYGYDSYYFQSINLTLVDQDTQKSTSFSYDLGDLFSNTDLIYKTIQLKSGSNNNVFMTYRTRFSGWIQIRMYIDRAIPEDYQLIKDNFDKVSSLSN